MNAIWQVSTMWDGVVSLDITDVDEEEGICNLLMNKEQAIELARGLLSAVIPSDDNDGVTAQGCATMG